jgi:hypothetical protein
MDVNQNLGGLESNLMSHTLHVLRLLNRFVACPDCHDSRRELEVFLDKMEDAEASGLRREIRDAVWYIKTASQVALSHLVVVHGTPVN